MIASDPGVTSAKTGRPNDRRGVLALAAISLAITAMFLGARFGIQTTRRFDPDELEHVHVAWEMSQGAVPYRDFFEMHPPLVHAMMVPILRRFDTATADGAMAALFALRRLAWVVSILLIGAAFELARRIDGLRTAWLAAPLIATDIVFAHRGMEIRPDGVAALCWLTTLILMHRAMTADPRTRLARVAFATGGAAIGCAVLASQKLLLAGPMVAAMLAWYVSGDRFGATRRTRVIGAVAYAIGCLTPWLALLGYFGLRHGAGALLHAVLFQDLAWRSEASPSTVLAYVARYDPWTFALAAAGACLAVGEAVTHTARRVANVLIVAASAMMFGGLFLIPVPFPQYCLTFLPLFAVLGAMGLSRAADQLTQRSGRSGVWPVALVIFTALAAIGLAAARPDIRFPWVYPLVLLAGAAALLSVRWHRQIGIGLAVVLVTLSVYPAQWTLWMRREGDGGQFAELRALQQMTNANAVVMDGWTGLGVFRAHAWYYWMLHPGVRAMVPRSAIELLEADLESGRVQPDVVILDPNLRQLSSRVMTFVREHYRASGVDDIYLPRAGSAGPTSRSR